jgi:hypothetical protein
MIMRADWIRQNIQIYSSNLFHVKSNVEDSFLYTVSEICRQAPRKIPGRQYKFAALQDTRARFLVIKSAGSNIK